jgi:glycosyltransferase involved in cell wall biosynthesis
LINFISNLPYDMRSGGFSAMNVAAFETVKKVVPTHYVGPISPPLVMWEKVVSKFLRTIGLRGAFYFFSRERLAAIAEEVHRKCDVSARLDFFHGFTPWILTKPSRRYIAWSDCTFHDYVNIYHRPERFGKEDIARIERKEAEWLKGAARVLFTSNWAAERAIIYYGLSEKEVVSVGIFGEMEAPSHDAYAGGKEFVFVSTDFYAKGGAVVTSAFRELRKDWPDASLIVIGDRPRHAAAEPGVSYLGFLRKEVPSEYKKFQQIISGARALVHPTRSDIAPLLIVEAGYCGCPAISSRSYAIPELIDHGRSGILLDDPSNPHSVAASMVVMLKNEELYYAMRKAAWRKARRQYSRSCFEERLLFHLQEVAGVGINLTI